MSGECNVCGHQGCIEANHPTTVTEADLLGQPWYAVPNAVIGGWCVINRDLPDNSAIETDDGGRELACFLSEGIARHVAWLHQAALGAVGWTAPDLRARVAELEGQLSDASHRAITATEEARVATGILAKLANAGAHTADSLLVRSTRGPIALTDVEVALFDAIREAKTGLPPDVAPTTKETT